VLAPSAHRHQFLFVVALACAAVVASSAQSALVPPIPFRGGVFEASGVVDVPGANGVLFVDDDHPKHVLWMPLSSAGVQAGDVTSVAIHATVPDMEDITTDGDWIYVVGSQSRGNRKADGLVRFHFHPDTLTVSDVQAIAGLRALLAAAKPELGLGRGRGAGALNIEGLTWDARRSRLLLGLRAPMAGADAIVLPVTIRDRTQPLTATNLDLSAPAIHLPLGGLAIRGLGYDRERHVTLVLAGPSTDAPSNDFGLYEWDGATAASLRHIGSYPAHQKAEGIARLTLGGARKTIVVFDSSGYRVQ
jgi:hypothetical protein